MLTDVCGGESRIAWKVRGLSRTSMIRTTQPQPPERSGIKGRATGRQ
ncbi:hypothetical protein [Rhizobium sp. WYJ-E13]|nr:hypothetical protein [Rhizobium sp. WYJ-E13]QWW69156.1 hypothetical protein KQ933_05485 [Rhizobium sp. WYJ-E13]